MDELTMVMNQQQAPSKVFFNIEQRI
jgi:hypothetical protein